MTFNDKINHSDSAQMIATGIAVGSDGRIDLGPAPTFWIINKFLWLAGAGELAKLSLLKIDGKFGHDFINIDK